MKKRLAVIIGSIVIANAAVAQETITLDQGAILVAAGSWQLCEGSSPVAVLCGGFVPGHEEYMLMIPAMNSASVGYQYSVSGTLASGALGTAAGAVVRSDNPYGYTVIVINLGGVATGIDIVVTDLVATTVTSKHVERVR